jgi:ribosomal protein S15P/S13E/SAM-dependent methyltransferase
MVEEPDSPEQLAEAIRRVAGGAESEMDLQVKVANLLHPYLQDVPGASPEKYGHHATRFRGIQDALHGNLIIEYERPGKLAKRAGLDECLRQLREYLTQEAQAHGKQATAALKRMVGVGLDGQQIVFVRYRGKGAEPFIPPEKRRPQLSFFPDAEAQDFYVDGPHPVTEESIATFLGYLHSLARQPLTPEALADTFGPKADITHAVIGDLYNKLRKTDNRRVETFFAEWQRIFGIVYGQDMGKAEADARALGKQFGVKAIPKLKQFLFCVHTYFALLMKLLAAEVMTLQRGAMMQSFITPLASATSENFRKALKDLEDGGVFARQGINNFLEGDFFSWYLSIWDKTLAEELRAMLRALARFDPRTPYLAPEQSRDLLKKLYQYLVPKKIRNDLGEFYTPDWLAEHLLNRLEYNGDLDKRLLDPACGSGTFLVLAIRRMKEWALQHDPPIDAETAAKKILEKLCGFDLNPIAVIAARTNFLLAMGELVRYVRPIEIPVYMCDSVLTPGEYSAGGLFKDYKIRTVADEFIIPREVVDRQLTEVLATLLEDSVRSDFSTQEFTRRAQRELALTQRGELEVVGGLYEKIHRLEKQNRNGIWARWLKNAFAPVFKGKFDYVAGNPPWVNWESLSDEYREATLKLWGKYGLFSLKGHAARLGGGKKDFAMLFTYAGMDSYLKNGGRLGFVITQTVFKTRGAGDGFRRFQLGKGLPLKVVVADDMIELKPFEGAANRTATVVLEKGQPTNYPVDYWVWRRNNGTIPYDATLDEALPLTRQLRLAAQPVEPAKLTSPWLTAPSAVMVAAQKAGGKSAYKGWEGSNTGGLNGAYWVRIVETRPDGLFIVENLGGIGKIKVPTRPHPLEPDLLYPLLRGRDVDRWRAKPSAYLILGQDPKARTGYPETWMKERVPNTYRYFKRFEDQLRKRSGFRKYFNPNKDPFWSMYNVGPYTLAAHKVVWREQAAQFTAAVVGTREVAGQTKPVIPDHKLMLVALETSQEAHYLCAALNSCVCRVAVKGYVVETQTSVHVLEHVGVPRFESQNPLHSKLAALSERAHELVARLSARPNDADSKRKLIEIEDQIDRAAAQMWGLTDAELVEIRKALELLR